MHNIIKKKHYFKYKKTVRDMEEILGSIEYAKTNRVLPANEVFLSILGYCTIKNNMPFKRILTEWYTNNPTIIVKNTDGTLKELMHTLKIGKSNKHKQC